MLLHRYIFWYQSRWWYNYNLRLDQNFYHFGGLDHLLPQTWLDLFCLQRMCNLWPHLFHNQGCFVYFLAGILNKISKYIIVLILYLIISISISAFWPFKWKYYLWLTDWSATYVESHGAGIIFSLSFFTSLQNKTVLFEEIKHI